MIPSYIRLYLRIWKNHYRDRQLHYGRRIEGVSVYYKLGMAAADGVTVPTIVGPA